MAGGKIRILWDRTETATVIIYGAAGQVSENFSVDGSPVIFPYTLTADTTFLANSEDRYSISVKLNDVEIADSPDGQKTVNLTTSGELTFAPSPDDGFVSASAATGGGINSESIVVATIDWTGSHNLTGSYPIPFDNVLEGAATFGANGLVLFTPGLYAVDIELDFATPTTDRMGVNSTLFSNSGTFVRHNFVVEDGVGTAGTVKLLSGVILVTSEGLTLTLGGAAGATDSLTVQYAYLSFGKIA